MKRNFSIGWLQAYQNYVAKQESPKEYHLWVGLSIIAGSLKRNVWIDREAYKIYPNQYIILTSENTNDRRSTAIMTGLDLLLANKNIKIIQNKSTVEGLIGQMNVIKSSTSSLDKTYFDGNIFICIDDLFSDKKLHLKNLISFLITIYSSKKYLNYLTHNKEFINIQNLCPTLLTSANFEQIKSIFPSFLGRALIVVGNRDKDAKFSLPHIDSLMHKPLLEDLQQIASLKGEIKLTPKCNEEFIKWYEINKTKKSPSLQLASYHERKYDHVLKCAMHLSLAESNEMWITKGHFKEAVLIIDSLDPGIMKLYGV